MGEEETQQLQNKVDKLKLLNLTSNIHSLTPPQKKDEPDQDNVALVSALRVSPRLAAAILDLQGRQYDPQRKEIVQVVEPIMNIKGIWDFISVCRVLAENTEWATYSEDEIPQRLTHYYECSLPYFTFWYDEYELNPRNFVIIENYLKVFIDSAFHKAKQGKYINTLGRTYSEDLLNKALSNEQQKKQKEGGEFSFLNPFKK
jgi:hypothetical protein